LGSWAKKGIEKQSKQTNEQAKKQRRWQVGDWWFPRPKPSHSFSSAVIFFFFSVITIFALHPKLNESPGLKNKLTKL